MRKVLVTGGAGFLGTYLVPLLRESYEVVSIDREELDITDMAAVRRVISRERPRLVCHLAALCGAAPSRENPPDYYAVNTLGTVHLLEACRRAGVGQFLFASSLTVHGSSPEPVNEASAFAPRHPYAASKVAAEFAVRDYSLHFGIRSIVLRPTLVVGEGSKELHALGDFVLKTLGGEEIVLFGGGEHYRDFVHPEDVAAAMVLAADRLNRSIGSMHDIFNISSGQALSMKQLANEVIRLVRSGRHRPGPQSNQSFSLHTRIDRARQELGFEPRIGTEDMILRLIQHFKETNRHGLPRMTIVITTINVPRLLEDYARNFERFGHLHEVSALIVGDRKTPHGTVADLAANLRMIGFDARYVDLEEQDRYLDRFPVLKPLIPFNSDNRRNIGYLMAAERGADIIVAVDDDNFVGDDDWYEGHALVGSTSRLKTVSSSSGWFNPCRLMDMESPVPTYARGYPYAKRHLAVEETYSITEGRVVLNGGMWLGDPDVDSLTRLTLPARAVRLTEERLMLAPGTWAPINTQNTAFHRDILPAFYFVPVGDPVSGIAVERYGDIWAGFFARKLIDHLDDRITFGRPACDHRRNAHNLLGDLELEFWSVILTDPLAEFLRGWSLTASSYGDAYIELADHLESAEWPHKRMAGEFKTFFTKMARAMRVWVETCRQLG